METHASTCVLFQKYKFQVSSGIRKNGIRGVLWTSSLPQAFLFPYPSLLCVTPVLNCHAAGLVMGAIFNLSNKTVTTYNIVSSIPKR